MKKFIYSLALALVGTFAQAQVKVGDNPGTINGGSVLEMESTNKGMLLPRVALTTTTSWGLSGVAVAGMQVYNTNASITAGTATSGKSYVSAGVGAYYWDGGGWVSTGATAPGGGGFRLIWAGYSPAPGTYTDSQGSVQINAAETYDSYNAGSGGIYTAPVSAYYTISQSFIADFTGPANVNGIITGQIAIVPASSGVAETRTQSSAQSLFGFSPSATQTITLRLLAGDQIKFLVTPCQGCANGSSYRVRLLNQTVSIYQ